MKLKYVILISLILFVISVGAVSASDDNVTSQLIGEDDSDVLEYSDDELISGSDNLEIRNWNMYEYGSEEVVRIYADGSDNISVSVDDVEYINKPLNTCEKSNFFNQSWYCIKQTDLLPLLSVGQYTLKVKFNNTEKSELFNILPMIEIPDTIYKLKSMEAICTLHDSVDAKGDVKIYVDDDLCYQGEFTSFWIYCQNLQFPSNFAYGEHRIKIIYTKSINPYTNETKVFSCEKKFVYNYGFDLRTYVYPKSVAYPSPKFIHDVVIYVKLPADAKEKVDVTFQGKNYKLIPENGVAILNISMTDLKMGKYTAYASYSDSKYPLLNLNSTFTVSPTILHPSRMAVGENDGLSIIAPKGSDGFATVYLGNYADNYSYVKNVATFNVAVKDGYAYVPFNKLSAEYYLLNLTYSIGGYNGSWVLRDRYGDSAGFSVAKNNPKYSSSISASEIVAGESVTISLKGPVLDEEAVIYLDDYKFKESSLSKGKISEKISGLTVGKHKLTIKIEDNIDFYSKTYYITVKKNPVKLTLKKVKVKRSAKKLVIKATLKINGKAVKGKKLKFKFNKKSYKAKTNKKGIAKIKIKKNVLKKLKVGKKVKYQVSYGKNTVKRTVKVKK